MRGKTLLELLNQLRAECRLSLNPAHNNQWRDTHVYLLQREQEMLWEEFTWPHLRVERQIAVQAGQRFMAPPADLKLDRIERLEFRYGLEWLKMTYGIGAVQYSLWNSDLDIRSWPVARWKIVENEMIELWPIPSNNADPVTLDGNIKFWGIRNLKPLVDDNDRADLDDHLIVLPVAIKHLEAYGKADSKLLISQLQRRLQKLRGELSKTGPIKLFGGTGEDRKHLRGPPRVQIRIEK